jgi:tetratricopeptide (TPR) repeat protein
MSDDFKPIRARSVPLSHAAPSGRASATGGARRFGAVAGVLLGAGLLITVFVIVPRLLVPDAPQRQTMPEAADGAQPAEAAAQSPASPSTGRRAGGAELAPFQEVQRAQVRGQAQAALTRFVELQLRLEAQLQVGVWGQEIYAGAKDLAARGDEAFLRERFDEAFALYADATVALEALIAQGEALLAQAIADGESALLARDAEAATAAFDFAASIAPDDPRIAAGSARAARLPEINELMRMARNQELSADWPAALTTLRAVQALDPATTDLADALNRVGAAANAARLQQVVSTGFSHLDASRHEQARQAFREALRLDPGNASAQGGLEQVDRLSEVARIDALQRQADAALAEERWADADRLYGQALALDANIQFAITGRSQARAQLRAHEALQAIIDEPDRLSSESHYASAQTMLEEARALESAGPALRARIEDVAGILQRYANPVPVVLRSDNQTQITVSSVGALGTFSEKELALRPGAYTVLGSRDGCRDIREQILVRADMAPIEIRCLETL